MAGGWITCVAGANQNHRNPLSIYLSETTTGLHTGLLRSSGAGIRPDVQRLLQELRVGIVGVGGTGSCVAEQLVRLGVGLVLIADGENFEATNVNRVYGSRVVDADIPKVKLAERMVADVGLGTKIDVIPKPITFESVLSESRLRRDFLVHG